MGRKLFVIGNWKMNGSFKHLDEFFGHIENNATDDDA
ncbi:unnamed protein product, partial [Hymenolepis diminuta]|uniref:Triose-phosphate isomerase n=1 Tax=Hymenolepis diminuta TaxID=6216 RepID=A0A0R3SA99_HYMDI